MDYKKIISDSWKLADTHRYLQWYAVVPMMAGLIVAMVYIPFRYGHYFIDGFSKLAFNFLGNFYEQYTSIFILGAIVVGFAFLIYLVFKAFFEGGLIGMTNHIIQNDHQVIPKSIGFAYGIKTYFSLLKLHALTSLMNPFYVILIMSILREKSPEIFQILFWPGLVIFLINVFLHFALAYSDYSLVMYQKSVMGSIRNSIHIVIFNFRETLFVLFVIILIVARAVLNLIILFLVPSALIWVGLKLTAIFPKTIIISLITIICFGVYFYLVKFATFITIFTHCIWVNALRALTEKTRLQLQVIEDETHSIHQTHTSDPSHGAAHH